MNKMHNHNVLHKVLVALAVMIYSMTQIHVYGDT